MRKVLKNNEKNVNLNAAQSKIARPKQQERGSLSKREGERDKKT